jgi:hypothetical protein
MPDEATISDKLADLYFKEQVERGMRDVVAGRDDQSQRTEGAARGSVLVYLKAEAHVMANSMVTQSNPISRADVTTLDEYLAEMAILRAHIDADTAEIRRLQSENRALDAETRAMLEALQAAVPA